MLAAAAVALLAPVVVVKALIVTRGAKGSLVFTGGQVHEIAPVAAPQVIDPTGCGDAYRAGLLYGLAHGYDWATTGGLASLLGSIKIGTRGGQNHRFTRAEIETRFREAYGRAPW